ncbi:hypothetical protein Scep_027674 [Stephania cephalantha]|uniref:Uncharacterized protein n=1 Tax=Stephania cephalantha TaxID=152367 RepID=A0AAP0ED07_9MAGN
MHGIRQRGQRKKKDPTELSSIATKKKINSNFNERGQPLLKIQKPLLLSWDPYHVRWCQIICIIGAKHWKLKRTNYGSVLRKYFYLIEHLMEGMSCRVLTILFLTAATY